MATRKTKTLADVTLVTTVGDDQYIPLADGNGGVTRVSLAALKESLLGGMTLDMMCDNVMIAYHALSGGYSRQAKLDTWPALQASGETADGVLLIEGGKSLIVAPDQAQLYWASATGDQGGGVFSDSREALACWDGEEQTAAHLEYEACQGEDYANGWCAAYSRLNANGVGYAAGAWWLPALGELDFIFAHKYAVRYALSLIEGATDLSEANYWSSTQIATYAWRVDFSRGLVGTSHKASDQNRVRPVTAYTL